MATSTSASIFLKGYNQLGKAVNGAVKDIGLIKKAADNASKTLRNVFELGTTVAVLKKVVKLSKEYFNNVTDPKVVSSLDKLKKTVNDMKSSISGFASDKISRGLEKVNTWFEKAKPAIESLINAVMGIIDNFPKAVGLAMNLISESITTLLDWDNFKPIINTIWSELVVLIKNLWSVTNTYMEYFIASMEESFAKTKVGQFFAANNKGTATYSENMANGIAAAKAFQNGTYVAENFDISKQVKKTAKQILEEANEAVTQMVYDFGIGVTSVGSTIKGSLDPVMDKYLKKLGELNTGASFSFNTGSVATTSKTNNFIDKFSTVLSDKLSSLQGVSSDQAKSAVSTTISNLTSSLGNAGTLISELATNMASMGPMLGAIVTALKYVFEGLAEVIGDIINDIVEYGLEPLREIGRLIGSFIKPVLEAILPLVKDSAISLVGIFKMIGSVLQPVIQIIASSLTPIMDALSNSFKVLHPVLQIFAKVLVTITGTMQYVVQVLQHWVATFMNWIAGLNLFGWKPFAGLAMTDPGSPGNYGSYIKNKWAEIDAAFENNAATGISSGTAVSSASYNGATNVTINIYQQAPVVGDLGMRQFAQMIRNEFEKLDYYGVTA